MKKLMSLGKSINILLNFKMFGSSFFKEICGICKEGRSCFSFTTGRHRNKWNEMFKLPKDHNVHFVYEKHFSEDSHILKSDMALKPNVLPCSIK